MEEKIFIKNKKGEKICALISKFDENSEIVIIVHGFSSSKDGNAATQFSNELTKRKIDHIRIDLNGAGESYGKFEDYTTSRAIDDLSATIDYLEMEGYESFLLFGSGAGGPVVSVYASFYPDKVTKLLLKNPSSDFLSHRTDTYGKKAIKEWKEKGYMYFEKSNGKKLKINYTFLSDPKNYIINDKAKDILCPTLIIHGDADKVVPLKYTKEWIDKIPNANLIIIKGAGHGLLVDKSPEMANKLFADWLEGKLILKGRITTI